MRGRFNFGCIAVVLLAAAAATPAWAADQQTGTLDSAIAALNADHINSIEYSGSGKWYQFGQEPNPDLPPPEFDVSSYVATIDYARATKRVQMTSKQTVDPGRLRPPRTKPGPTSTWSATFPGSPAARVVPQPVCR